MPKILLVEDDASIIESLSQYLEGEGFYNLNIATTKKWFFTLPAKTEKSINDCISWHMERRRKRRISENRNNNDSYSHKPPSLCYNKI